MKLPRPSQAFTLIELLVVIAIVAVLAAILFPVFARVKAAAKSKTCLSNIRQIGHAAALYGGDFDDHVPGCADMIDKFSPAFKGTTYEGVVSSYPLLNRALEPYTKSREVFRCPEDRGMHVADLTFPYSLEASPSAFERYGLSYRWNAELCLKNLTFSSVPKPSGTDLLSDASGSWHAGLPLMSSDNADDFPTQSLRYNVGFADLHARFSTHEELVEANREITP